MASLSNSNTLTLKLVKSMGDYLDGRVFELINFQSLLQLTVTNAGYTLGVGIPYIQSLGSLYFGYYIPLLVLVGTRGLKSLVVWDPEPELSPKWTAKQPAVAFGGHGGPLNFLAFDDSAMFQFFKEVESLRTCLFK